MINKTSNIGTIPGYVAQGEPPSEKDALALTSVTNTAALIELASSIRDAGFGNVVTYSRKVFIPLTRLCRDVCHYCTFATTPRNLQATYLGIDEVIKIAHDGASMGCKEALFTLGEKPEIRYRAAREWLETHGYKSTIDYLRHAANLVFEETGLLPHLNPGNMTMEEFRMLRSVAPSMGMMLESSSERLTRKGQPHYGSPDKVPAIRLQTLSDAGGVRVPTTTGVLIGIGETRRERIDSLLDIRRVHQQFGHIQEVIVQNFRAKPGTKMHSAPEPDLEELLWTISVARIIFGSGMSIQAPPNLSPGVLPQIVNAGVNDWGGVSPLTPDFVNPEAPWPHLDELEMETARAGKSLEQRLTIYPRYASNPSTWMDERFHQPVLDLIDSDGLPRTDRWIPGDPVEPPRSLLQRINEAPKSCSKDIGNIIKKTEQSKLLNEQEIMRLFEARGNDFNKIIQAANELRRQKNGDVVSYVVNRNINYTNICYFKCQFCAFSKGKLSENLRGRPYDLSADEIQRRVVEAWERGATEVCMQGGIHPEYTGKTYLNIVRTVKDVVPQMHVHAFSPLEIWQGAATLSQPLEDYLQELKAVGLDTLPGTAAEILDDEVRAMICPDKINTQQWLNVMEAAHRVGLRTTATIMYGHVDGPIHWARHLTHVRDLQIKTGGFTEFVPLPFIHREAPMYLKGKARKGPTFREAILMHAVARLVLHPHITNIQTSWVKMGHRGAIAALDAGCNDLGGTLMNESISRAAGTLHGQETSPRRMIELIESAGRIPRQRTTLYEEPRIEDIQRGMNAASLSDIVNTPSRKYERKRTHELVRNTAVDTAHVS